LIGGVKSGTFGRPQKTHVEYGGRRLIPGSEPPKTESISVRGSRERFRVLADTAVPHLSLVWLRSGIPYHFKGMWGTLFKYRFTWPFSRPSTGLRTWAEPWRLGRVLQRSPPFLVRFRVFPLRFSVFVGWLRRILRCWWRPVAATPRRRNMLYVFTRGLNGVRHNPRAFFGSFQKSHFSPTPLFTFHFAAFCGVGSDNLVAVCSCFL